MLKLTVILSDDFDEEQEIFITESVDIELEHSLASLSKWERIWEIPLLSTTDKTPEQTLSYLECMCLTPNIAPEVFQKLTREQQQQIADYLDKKNSATFFGGKAPESRSGQIITAELIYYWMDELNIDWRAEDWPLNSLLSLVKIHSVKGNGNKPKQQSSWSQRSEMAAEIARRNKELGTNG